MRGKDFIGRTVMGWSTGRSSMRVLQVRRGRPLTSAEHEHARSDGHAVVHRLPALRIAAENAQGGFFHHGSPFCERRMASSQRRGRAEPKTFHLVKLVGPM